MPTDFMPEMNEPKNSGNPLPQELILKKIPEGLEKNVTISLRITN